jgi:diacylglycerol O-acyltransferase / wax synthase
VLLDASPEPLDIPAPEEPWDPRSYDRTRHLARLAATPIVRGQKLLLDSATRALAPDPRRAAGDGRPVAKPLVALVPVSVRRPGEEGGNAISFVLVDLPVGESDPAARIAAIHTTMAEIKDSAAIRAGALLLGASGWAPPLVSSALARATGTLRAFNVVVSNVPGPQQPFWLNGCKLLAIHPAVPLNPATQGLSVGIVSYDGKVCFGLLADRDLDPPVQVAAQGLRDALDELRGA